VSTTTARAAAEEALVDAVANLSPAAQVAAETFRRLLIAERKVEREKAALMRDLMRCDETDLPGYAAFTDALIARYPADA
jgi:hypothetical protein